MSIEFAYSLLNTPERKGRKERKKERKKMNIKEGKRLITL
jgi:hypothetical protein